MTNIIIKCKELGNTSLCFLALTHWSLHNALALRMPLRTPGLMRSWGRLFLCKGAAVANRVS